MALSVSALGAQFTPVEDGNVTTSNAWVGGTRNLSDQGGDGALWFKTSNLLIDANSTIIMGNGTSGSYGFNFSNLRNVTISSFTISNYSNQIFINNATVVLTGQPYFSSVATAVTNIKYNYSTDNLQFSCSGTGAITVTGLTGVVGTSGSYEVLKDDVHIAYASSNTYAVNSCGTWEFVGSDANVIISQQITGMGAFGTDLGNFLSNLAPGVGIFILLLSIFGGVGAIVYALVVVIKKTIGDKE